MEKLLIEGGRALNGTIRVSGAKNSAVALIPATILKKLLLGFQVDVT